jgi:hypothetical protein
VNRFVVSLSLFLAVVVFAAFGAGALSQLIDQPWDEVREPILSDGMYTAIFGGLAALFLGAALALGALLARRLGIVGHQGSHS